MKPSIIRQNKIIRLLLAAGFWIAVWILAAFRVGQPLILPTPRAVLQTLLQLCTQASFWLTALFSLLRIFSGFLAGVILGTLLAVLTSWSSLLDAILSPVIRIIRATPVASFIILAILWIGRSMVSTFIAMLMVTPVLWGNVCTGIQSTDPQLLEMSQVYRFGLFKTCKLIYIPTVFPLWSSGCITSLGLAWKAGIAAEVLCQPATAIGTELYYSKIYYETPSLFAWTTVVILLSFLLEKGFSYLIQRRVK